MTDPTPDTSAAEPAPDSTAAPDTGTTAPEAAPDATGPPDPGSGEPASEEAKRYRLRLRETETERDTLRTRLEGAQRREVERVAAGSLADPADLWSDAELGDMLTDDGDVDEAAVTATVEALVTAKPHYAKRGSVPKPDPSQGPRGADVEPKRMGAIFGKK